MRRSDTLDLPFSLENATYRRGKWFLGGHGPLGYQILVGTPDRGWKNVPILPPFISSRGTLDPVHLHVGQEGLVVSRVRPPFGGFLIDWSGRGATEFPPLIPPGASSAEELGKWIAMPVIGLDRGYLQSFGNPNSDRRVFSVKPALSSEARMTSMDVPLVFLAANPSSSVLVGALDLGRLELVGYRWRWAVDPPSSSTEDHRSRKEVEYQ